MICTSLEEFASDFHNQIMAEAHMEDEEKFLEDVFVDRMIDFLHDAQELENGMVCSYKGYGMKVNGYDLNNEENTLSLLVAHYEGSPLSIASKVGKADVEAAFKRALTFLTRSRKGYHEKLEQSCEVYDLAKTINKNGNIRKARIILLSNGLTGRRPAVTEEVDGLEVMYQIWDLERLFHFVSSGMKRDPVVVDFVEETGAPLPCLKVVDSENVYTTYISIVPGNVLLGLYDRWGTRLLERNVRAFLQARGKVNKGIRDTITAQPHMFLAFNNGITVTGEEVEIEELSGGGIGIRKVKDFQIVNGGQTVASLWHTQTKKKACVDSVAIQMKLTVLSNPDKIEEITPLISKYSNTQNKVNTADFQANDPFHISLEERANTVWAPDPTGGGQVTKWFYERARGSFDEIRNRERTPARIKAWDAVHPRKQKFDKLMLGKVEKTWRLQPQKVSLGAQKNFADYTIDLKEEGIDSVDEGYFKGIIARFIIWQAAEKIVSAQNIPGYRANIVTYTLAWLIKLTGNRLNLPAIWDKQDIGDSLREAIDYFAHKVREHITDTELNVTEWCKKDACWKKLEEKEEVLPESLKKELLNTGIPVGRPGERPLGDEDHQLIAWTVNLGKDFWKKLSRWGSVTGSLEPWQNSIAFSIGKALARGKDPSYKQARQGKKMYDKAMRLGFNPDSAE